MHKAEAGEQLDLWLASAQRAGRDPEESLSWALGICDILGRGLDPGSVLPVAALHFIGIETTASCDGHPDRGLPFPWINLSDCPEELLCSLPSWTIVQRGQGGARSYRLNPREITSIECSTDLPSSYWDAAREELQGLARVILGQSATTDL